MPKYYDYKVFGYFLYFTSKCIVECMHVHASDDHKLREKDSAKLFVQANGDTEVMKKGSLSSRDLERIRGFIKEHYIEMHDLWSEWSDNDYYRGKN